MKRFECVQLDLPEIRKMVLDYLVTELTTDESGLRDRIESGDFSDFNMSDMSEDKLYEIFRDNDLGKCRIGTADFVYTCSEDDDHTLIVLYERQRVSV